MTDGSALARNWHPVSLAQLIEEHDQVRDEIQPISNYPVRVPRLPPRKPKE